MSRKASNNGYSCRDPPPRQVKQRLVTEACDIRQCPPYRDTQRGHWPSVEDIRRMRSGNFHLPERGKILNATRGVPHWIVCVTEARVPN